MKSQGTTFLRTLSLGILGAGLFPESGLAQRHSADCWLENDSAYGVSSLGVQPSLSDLQAKIRSLAGQYGVPVEIVGAVCYQESTLYQFASDGFVIHNKPECKNAYHTGYINAGQTLPPPPGLGLMQLTSSTATSQFEVARLIQDWGYNLEAGVQILLQKYNHELSLDPPWMQTLEVQNKNVLENWYYALAAYNGSSSYIDRIYALVASPPARIAGLFTQATINEPTAVISGFTYQDSFVALPDGTWYDGNQTPFQGTAHISGGGSDTPPRPPQLTGPWWRNGAFGFTLNGPVGSNYVIQVSSDLMRWAPYVTNLITQRGSVPVTDQTAGAQGRRFYRAVSTRITTTVDLSMPMTGFSRDVLLENTAVGGDTSPYVEPFDTSWNIAFCEKGLGDIGSWSCDSPSPAGAQ